MQYITPLLADWKETNINQSALPKALFLIHWFMKFRDVITTDFDKMITTHLTQSTYSVQCHMPILVAEEPVQQRSQ